MSLCNSSLIFGTEAIGVIILLIIFVLSRAACLKLSTPDSRVELRDSNCSGNARDAKHIV